jgi:hypothetical protein
VLPTSGTGVSAAVFDTFPIPAPSSTGSPVAGQPTASFNALPAGERVMTLFGGDITAMAYVSQGSLTAAQAETRISVTFTVTSPNAVLAWGGHIGSREDWGFVGGVPRSAGGISGSPYHMRTISWNLTNLGNTDRSMSAQAVIAPPAVTVVKTASPLNLPEPGGNFTFSVAVTNTGIQQVTLTTLTDDIYGNLNGQGTCATGGTIAAGATYNCSFTGAFTGNAGATQTDIVTAIVTNSTGVTATDTDDAIVGLTDVAPTINVTKTAGVSSLPEPGGNVTFTFVVTNTSAENLTITSLSDNVYGTLAGDADCQVGTVLAAGANCSFTHVGAVSGNAGSSHTNTVTACGDDDDAPATPVCDTDDETVTITDVGFTIDVDKSSDPTTLQAPGGTVTFTVDVTNNSATESVTLTDLDDNLFGDLFDDAGNALISNSDCADNTVIAAGDTYTCTFDATVSGSGGDSHTNTVTGCATDGETEDCDDGSTTVTITEPPGGNLFHTGTTCDQFLGNTPPSGLAGQEINQVNYSVKGGKISQLDPGVFFYFTEITASGASLVATIEQTPPAGYNNPFAIQNASNVRVFDANCNTYSNFTIGSLANGDVTVTINGTTAGSDYIISVKYETSSLKGLTPPPGDPSAAWNWATIVNAVVVDSDPDGIVLDRK